MAAKQTHPYFRIPLTNDDTSVGIFLKTIFSRLLAADWFTEWPAEALKGVAMAMMTETDLELGGALEGIVEMFRYVRANRTETTDAVLLSLGERYLGCELEVPDLDASCFENDRKPNIRTHTSPAKNSYM